MNELDQLCINTIRMLSVDMVQRAESGHPGMPMGAATMAYVLWTRHLRHNPKNPAWPNRDRFVLSAGHASALLYSLLHLTGYDLSLDDLKQFRQWGSRTPGHPERGCAPGVEVTTGPLGQGLGNALGMAIAERWLAATFNRPSHEVVNHHTYVLASDGDMMEGLSSEAASLAGTLRLGRLIVLYDANRVTLSGTTDLTFLEDVGGRFEACGWQVQRIDGQDVAAVDRALTNARIIEDRPSLIVARTHIGYGSPKKQGTFRRRASRSARTRCVRPNVPWVGPRSRRSTYPGTRSGSFGRRLTAAPSSKPRGSAEWTPMYPVIPTKPEASITPWRADCRTAGSRICRLSPADGDMATRDAGGAALAALAAVVADLVGGSADLDPSTRTAIKGAVTSRTRSGLASMTVRRRRGAPAASGATPDATSTSVFASTPWPRR